MKNDGLWDIWKDIKLNPDPKREKPDFTKPIIEPPRADVGEASIPVEDEDGR